MLRVRAISAVYIVLATLIPGLLGGVVFTIALTILAAAATREALTSFQTANQNTHTILSPVLAGATLLMTGLTVRVDVITIAVFVILVAPIIASIASGNLAGATDRWVRSASITMYIAIPLAFAVLLRNISGDIDREWVMSAGTILTDDTAIGFAWLATVIACTWLTDTFAYFGGRAFGNTKLYPALSPGKTIEGAASGMIASGATGAVAVLLLGLPVSWYIGIIFGLIIGVFGQLGDLAESLIKRNLALKDMGTLIPGHGGLLDRIDALLFTLPVGYILVLFIQEVLIS